MVTSLRSQNKVSLVNPVDCHESAMQILAMTRNLRKESSLRGRMPEAIQNIKKSVILSVAKNPNRCHIEH